ncbi:barstar family protein [Deinococcus detaillensis]|uniref:Barstar family protein n=1 Tax=Deinococcus detaillensis TaxID=2592048 RepID=A0A553V493_9DEIO|nr:barstar family protein [Deinococcus detaillensis]TSA87318.1 barstar family protein [Deinococcus detaillensis]
MSIFESPPEGIQPAPAEPRMVAAGAQVRLREVNLGNVSDKDDLMLAFANDLTLTPNFGRNWDALYDVLSDPEQVPERLALVLCSYPDFERQHPKLAAQLTSVLLDAQTALAARGKALWLLSDVPESEG